MTAGGVPCRGLAAFKPAAPRSGAASAVLAPPQPAQARPGGGGRAKARGARAFLAGRKRGHRGGPAAGAAADRRVRGGRPARPAGADADRRRAAAGCAAAAHARGPRPAGERAPRRPRRDHARRDGAADPGRHRARVGLARLHHVRAVLLPRHARGRSAHGRRPAVRVPGRGRARHGDRGADRRPRRPARVHEVGAAGRAALRRAVPPGPRAAGLGGAGLLRRRAHVELLGVGRAGSGLPAAPCRHGLRSHRGLRHRPRRRRRDGTRLGGRPLGRAGRALAQRYDAAVGFHHHAVPAGAPRDRRGVNERLPFQDGEQVLLIDQRGKRHLIFLRKSETFHSDRGWIPHDSIIGQPEGSWVRSSMGLRYLGFRPTLAEFALEMPRGAQVIYPKDLAMILFWADAYPGCYVPTIIQSHQVTEALQRERAWALVETFETLVRPWNIEGTSVRPFHRMVAHTGFITVARRVVPEEGGGTLPRLPLPERDE